MLNLIKSNGRLNLLDDDLNELAIQLRALRFARHEARLDGVLRPENDNAISRVDLAFDLLTPIAIGLDLGIKPATQAPVAKGGRKQLSGVRVRFGI